MLQTKTLFMRLLFVLMLLLPSASRACPGCAQAVSGALGNGFNHSILFLMAMPFTVVGGVALCLLVLHRRHRSAMVKSAAISIPESQN